MLQVAFLSNVLLTKYQGFPEWKKNLLNRNENEGTGSNFQSKFQIKVDRTSDRVGFHLFS